MSTLKHVRGLVEIKLTEKLVRLNQFESLDNPQVKELYLKTKTKMEVLEAILDSMNGNDIMLKLL